jgi:uncharacterized protein YjbK
MTTKNIELEIPVPQFKSDAVASMSYGKDKAQFKSLSLLAKLEKASNQRTIERFILTKDQHEKLNAFCCSETCETSSRCDHYYDSKGMYLLKNDMYLRIREDKDASGCRRVALKLREREMEGYIYYVFSPKEVEKWESTGKEKIPASVLENAKIRPAAQKTVKVGFISTTRAVFLDGFATLDNSFFSSKNRNFKNYEIRLKNEDYKERLHSMMQNKFLCIPVEPIAGSRYQRLMQI